MEKKKFKIHKTGAKKKELSMNLTQVSCSSSKLAAGNVM